MPEKHDKQAAPEAKPKAEAKAPPRQVYAPLAPAAVREPPRPAPADLLAAHVPDEVLGMDHPNATPERQAERLARVDAPVRQALVSRWQTQRGNLYVQRLLKHARAAAVQRTLAPQPASAAKAGHAPAPNGHAPPAPRREVPVQRAIFHGRRQADYGGQTPEHLLKLKEPEHTYDKLKEEYLKYGKPGLNIFVHNLKIELRTANPADELPILSNVNQQRTSIEIVADATIPVFDLAARAAVGEMLKASDAAIEQQMKQYGITEGMRDDPDLKAHVFTGEYTMAQSEEAAQMSAAAAQLVEEHGKLIKVSQKLLAENPVPEVDIPGVVPHYDFDLGKQPEYIEARQNYEQVFARLSGQFPLLAAFKDSPMKMAEFAKAGTSPVAATMLGKELAEKQKNIRETRENLDSGKLKIWSLNNIVQGTKAKLNYVPTMIESKAVDEYKADKDSEEKIKNIAIAALGITVGIISAVATGGGSIAVAAAAGSAVISTAQLVDNLQNYMVESAASNTAIDKATSVSQSDPSLFWVAVDLLAAGLDIYGAGKAFKALAGPIRNALAARRAVEAAKLTSGAADVAKGAEAAGKAGEMAIDEINQLAKSIDEMEAAARSAGVPEGAINKIKGQVEGPVKGYIVNPEKPLSSAGFKGSLAEKGSGFGVFDGHIPGVQEPVVIKVYPDTDEFKEVFARELAGAHAAGQTGIGPKCFGEVSVGPGKKAFAMEKVGGSMPEVTTLDELQEAVAKAANAEEAAKAQAALDKAVKEAAQTAAGINKTTIADVRAYGERVLQKGTFIQGDLQGLVDAGGRWRPIDFQGHYPLPDKLKNPEAYARALKDHEFQLQKQIEMLIQQGPKPLPDAPIGTLPHYRLPPGSPIGAPVQPFREGQTPTAVVDSGAADVAGTTLADRIASLSGGGAPLDAGLADEFSQRLGADLSGVRVHTGAEADQLNAAVGALAFTTGQDIFFSAGSYTPGSEAGRRLLAHEVAHTVQQAEGPVDGTPAPGGIAVSDPGDSFEQAAEATAEALAQDGAGAARPDTTAAAASGDGVPTSPARAAATVQRSRRLSVQRQHLEHEHFDDGPKPLDDDEETETITIDEEGVTQADYKAPNFTTKDEKITPAKAPDGTKPEDDWVDISGKVAATFKVETKVTLPTVPSNLTACQKKRVQDAIDKQLSPHEDKHVAAMKKYDGSWEGPIEVKRVLRKDALTKLTEAAKEAANVEAARRKKEAQDASDALDVPPFVVVVDLDCEDKKQSAEGLPLGLGDDVAQVDMFVAGQPVQMMAVQRFITDTPLPAKKPPPGTPEEIQAAIDARDKGMIKAIHDFSRATPAQKQAMINILLEGWTGPFDENALQRIWSSFGPGILNLDAGWVSLFERCLDAGAEVKYIAEVAALEPKFKKDVKGLATGHLYSNYDHIAAEAQKFAAPEGYEPGSTGPTESSAADAKIEEQQKFAELLLEAQKQQQDLTKIPVGWKPMQAAQHGQPDEGEVDTSDYEFFDPGRQPFQAFDNEPGVRMAHWADVKKQWDELGVAMSKMTDENPALYALMVTGKLKDFGAATPDQGRNQIMESFKSVGENIYKTAKAIAEDDLDYRDLLPIHAQVRAGPGASGVDWSKPFAKMIIEKQIIADYKANEDLLNDLLGGVAFVAFIVAEFATGGLATLVPLIIGVAASAAPAAISWEKYGDMTTAADTAVKSGTELVYKEQISAVFIEAIINTAAAFLDLYGAGKTVRTKLIRPKDLLEGVGAGRRAFGGLKDLDRLPRGESEKLAERAIDELGVAGAMSKSGRSAEELLYIIPADSPAYARIKAYLALTKSGAKEVKGKLATLSLDLAEKRITREEADQLVSLAIDAMGPVDVLQQCGGWQKLSLMLGNESAAGKRLNAWRTNLWQDLQAYINSLDLDPGELENIKRTGSQGSFGSDLDMSSLGSLSAEHREQARSFMAGRVGVEPGKLHSILYADFFTDPRRMHLLDQLPAEARAKIAASQARKEQTMMLNLMYQDALAHGDDATAKSVKEMMDAASVPIVKVEPISKAEISAFERDIDKLQRELIDTQDVGRKAAIIEEIADKQAKINHSEGGGYFTGGGVRREVSEREKLGDYAPGGAAPGMAIPQRLTAMLDNALKLFHAAQGLPAAATADELAGTLKAVGKYGSRFSSEFSKDGLAVAAKIPGQARFDAIADKFDTWLLQARADPESLAKLGKKASADPTVKVMSMQQLLELKGEGKALKRELQAALGDFRQVLYEAHGALTKEAGLAKLPANYAATQSYLLIQGKILVIQDAGSHIITGLINALDLPEEAAEQEASEPGSSQAPPPGEEKNR